MQNNVVAVSLFDITMFDLISYFKIPTAFDRSQEHPEPKGSGSETLRAAINSLMQIPQAAAAKNRSSVRCLVRTQP